jgi:hypothetical protein
MALSICAVGLIITVPVMRMDPLNDLGDDGFFIGPYVAVGVLIYLGRANPSGLRNWWSAGRFTSGLGFVAAIVIASIASFLLPPYFPQGDNAGKGMALGIGALLQWGVVAAGAVPGFAVWLGQRRLRNVAPDGQIDTSCLSCGASIPAGFEVCPKCGWSYNQTKANSRQDEEDR